MLFVVSQSSPIKNIKKHKRANHENKQIVPAELPVTYHVWGVSVAIP